MLKRFTLAMTIASLLTGCAAQTVMVQAPFDAEQAAALVKPGVNIISGSALIRQNGGGVVTCAGLPILLVPKTAYASERIKAIYGNTQRGHNPAHRAIQFEPDVQSYGRLQRNTLCDAQGNFSFSDVADGSFYVIANITWNVGGSIQGGGLMQAVTVSGGASQEVVLSP